MKGCEARLHRRIEVALFQAHQTARMTAYSGNKLPRLEDEMNRLRRALQPRRQQSRADMLAAMRAQAARTTH